MNAVRGFCEAYVAAFDRHWNLALEDVREVWTRRKKKKVPAIGKPPINNLFLYVSIGYFHRTILVLLTVHCFNKY